MQQYCVFCTFNCNSIVTVKTSTGKTRKPNCILTTTALQNLNILHDDGEKKQTNRKTSLPDRASPSFPFVHVTATVYGIPISRRHRNFDNFSDRLSKKHTNSRRLSRTGVI